MNEHTTPVIPDEKESELQQTPKRSSSWWSARRKLKLLICIIIIIVVALGFWHQHHVRSDKYIKSSFENNKETFQVVADYISLNTICETPTLKRGKLSIRTLCSDDACKDIKPQLEELERRNIAYISCDTTTVTFYTIYDYNYVYYTPLSSLYPVSEDTSLGNGWMYVKISKS